MLPTTATTAPAHHNKVISAKSALSKGAVLVPEGPDLMSPDMQRAPNAVSNPLRQKSSLVVKSTLEGDEDPDDVIPSLPHVSYSAGGQTPCYPSPLRSLPLSSTL